MFFYSYFFLFELILCVLVGVLSSCFVWLLWCVWLDFYLGAIFNCFAGALVPSVLCRIFTCTHILATVAMVFIVTVSCVCWTGWPRIFLAIHILFIHAAVTLIQYCVDCSVSHARHQMKEGTINGCKGLKPRLNGIRTDCFLSSLLYIFVCFLFCFFVCIYYDILL